jgi:hypothetical protein
LHVDNHDFYLCSKNQLEILYILGCVKKTNFDKIQKLPAGQYLSILCRPEYNLFCIEILKDRRVRHC